MKAMLKNIQRLSTRCSSLLSQRSKRLTLLHLLFPLLFISSAQAAKVFVTPPIKAENRSPFIQHYAIARPDYHFTLPTTSEGKKAARWQSTFEIANYLSQTRDKDALLSIDGETWIWQNSLLYSINDQFLLNITIPWIRHSEGYTDRFIYHFHDAFQLPQNGRKEDASDRYAWLLRDSGETLFFTNSPESSMGDLRFALSWNSETYRDTQFQAHVELPTGQFEEQSGNGGLDAGFSFVSFNPDWMNNREWLEDYRLSFWYGFGLSYLSHDSQLNSLDPIRWSASARSGIGWALNEQWQLKLQLDTHTALFGTEIRELGWIPIQLSMGTEYIWSPKTRLQLSLVEDLRPRVTPDATFSFGITQDF